MPLYEAEQLTGRIIGLAIEVHRELGPGLLESAYEQCLWHELTTAGISARRQIDLPLRYKGFRLDCSYRIDILVDEAVVLEIKAVEKTLPIHEAQLLTYLRLGRYPVGLILNFNVPVLKDGILRRAMTHVDPL